MSKIDKRVCDVCGDDIGASTHLRFRRWLLGGFYVRLADWGIVDHMGLSGWRKKHVDICESCWDDVVDEVSERVE